MGCSPLPATDADSYREGYVTGDSERDPDADVTFDDGTTRWQRSPPGGALHMAGDDGRRLHIPSPAAVLLAEQIITRRF